MLNLLGEADGEAGLRAAHAAIGRALAVPGASVHWYGKEEVKTKRKARRAATRRGGVGRRGALAFWRCAY